MPEWIYRNPILFVLVLLLAIGSIVLTISLLFPGHTPKSATELARQANERCGSGVRQLEVDHDRDGIYVVCLSGQTLFIRR